MPLIEVCCLNIDVLSKFIVFYVLLLAAARRRRFASLRNTVNDDDQIDDKQGLVFLKKIHFYSEIH